MGKRAAWEQLGEPVQLDVCHDLARVPPILDGFTDFCWKHLLVEHDVYVENRRQETTSTGYYSGTFRCSSHVGCAKQRKTCMEYQARLANRQVTFFKRTDRFHDGADRKIEGLTVAQWKLSSATHATSVEAVALEFAHAGVPKMRVEYPR